MDRGGGFVGKVFGSFKARITNPRQRNRNIKTNTSDTAFDTR